MGKSNPDLIGAAVVIPLLQSGITAGSAALLTIAGSILLGADQPLAYGFLASAIVFVVAWLGLMDRWYRLMGFESNPPPSRPFRVELAVGRSTLIYSLPASQEQLTALARAVLSGATLNELSFSSIFTRSEWRRLRDELIRRGLAEWRSASPAQGVQLTRTGLAVFRYLAASPTFKPGHVLEKY
jgi:hypothetical protein